MGVAEQVQWRRQTDANVKTFTGADGEIIVNQSTHRLHVQDGVTPGGFPQALLADVSTGGSVTFNRHAVANVDAAVSSTDNIVAYTSITASRVVTLCAANAYPQGVVLGIIDESGACSPTMTLTVAAASGDTINNAASYVLNSGYSCIGLESNGSHGWTVVHASTSNMVVNRLSVGTGYDPNNVVSVNGTSALLSSGSDFRVTVNKHAAGNTASVVFQDNYSARAEFGLTGDDNFHMKVSPDGSTWKDAININSSTGSVNLVAPLGYGSGGTNDTGTGSVPYTANIYSSVGTIASFTSACKYKLLANKICVIFVNFTITNNGTGSGSISISLPFASASGSCGSARETAVNGTLNSLYIPAGIGNIAMFKYDNSYAGVSNGVYVGQITYETV